MAGLGVLLESHHQKTFQKCPQIISKTTHGLLLSSNNRKNKILSATVLPSPPPPLPLQRSPSFLERCYLCHDRLLEGKDIYMYRGDRAFCSEECRCRQICMDEEAAAAAASSAAPRRRCGKSRAGGFGY